MEKCSNCHAPLDAGAQSCARCGASRPNVDATPRQQTPQPQQQARPQAPQGGPQQPQAQAPQRVPQQPQPQAWGQAPQGYPQQQAWNQASQGYPYQPQGPANFDWAAQQQFMAQQAAIYGGDTYLWPETPDFKPKNFGDTLSICFSKYCRFQGRATRSEYWQFYAWGWIFGLVPCVGLIFGLAALLPNIGLLVRRLHDSNRSGWNFCWFFLPIVGWIILFVYLLSESTRGPNRFGPQPINPNAAPNWNAPNAASNWNAPNAASNWNAPNAASNWASSGDEAAEATSLEELLAKLNSLESDEPNVGPSFFGSFAYCWKNCFNFNGRANRTEWWGFHFAVAAPIAAFCYLAISILGIRLDLDEMKLWGLGVFAAALSLPSLALTVRRLHDLGMAGSVLTSKLVEMGIAIVIGVVLAGLARIPVGAIIVTIIVAIQILALWGKIAFAPGTFGFNLYGSRRLNPSDVKQS